MSVAGMRRNNGAYDTAERLILSLIASRMPVSG
jgi:hypothetical protein